MIKDVILSILMIKVIVDKIGESVDIMLVFGLILNVLWYLVEFKI